MKKIITLLVIIFFGLNHLKAQSDGTYDYKREFLWGINKSTTSGLIGGLVFRFGVASSEDKLKTMGFELINIKHPAEVALVPGSSFKINKINYLYSIRGRYGTELLLFKKSSQHGVQINAHFAAGPTIGLESPYYILDAENRYTQYDPDIHNDPSNQIQGAGLPFQGLFKSKIIPGLNLKGSLLFEFGTFKTSISGIELGLNIEAFSRAPRLQYDIESPSIFTAAFVNLFYGNRK